MSETPALEQLAGAYFHQDWDVEFHDDEWLALRQFLDEEADLARRLPQEIDHVLTRFATDDEVRDFLLSLGSCYTADVARGGYRGWLAEISRRSQSHEATSS